MKPAPSLIRAVCEDYGGRTRAVLASYLPERPRDAVDRLITEYPRRGGKMMRPSLLIAAARAFGAPLEPALHAAAALEMLHNASLIHDDIQDGSEERRGRPALHVENGIPVALGAGYALALQSLRPLIDNSTVLGPSLTLRVFEELERMVSEAAEGQALELGWQRDNVLGLSEADYLRMVLKKTCWLTFIYPCRVGALIAGAGEARLDGLVRFGFLLGAVFQIQDDILNLAGTHELYGKEIDGDLWEGKRTLMLIHLWRRATPGERRRLTEILSRRRSEQCADDIRWLRGRIDAYGGLEYARQYARSLGFAALREYMQLFAGLPHSRDKSFIAELVPWALGRSS